MIPLACLPERAWAVAFAQVAVSMVEEAIGDFLKQHTGSGVKAAADPYWWILS